MSVNSYTKFITSRNIVVGARFIHFGQVYRVSKMTDYKVWAYREGMPYTELASSFTHSVIRSGLEDGTIQVIEKK